MRKHARIAIGRGACLRTAIAAAFVVIAAVLPTAVANAAPARIVSPAGVLDARGVRTPAEPKYKLDLTSDAQGFVWKGTESVSFKNVDADPLKKVWIRLWDNGLSGCTAPLSIKVSNVQGGTAGRLAVDCTALPVSLARPLDKGQTAKLTFDLKIRIPDQNWRFGRIGSMALVGNAIPLLAIHDKLGWHLEPYTPNGESFYSQVSNFTVTFHTPKALKLPATGVVSSESTHGGIRTTVIEADQVRDFAWASGPLSEEEDFAATGVLVKVWWEDPITKAQADGLLQTGLAAMASHAAAYGSYPYSEVDVVVGNFSRFGGMEYPQFVMNNTGFGVLVHELAHQWWFGLVGDDEYTEPWLDEAFATYATDLYFGNNGGGCANPPNWPAPDARVTNSMAYWDQHPTWYGQVVYFIGSCALHDLSHKLGDTVMVKFLRHYAIEHALGWSTTDAFKAEAQKVADGLPHPLDLTRFWNKHRIEDVP